MGKNNQKEGNGADKDTKVKNFRWSRPMEDLMLEILADEALKGNKPSSTFKLSSFAQVASAINEKFGVSCFPDHVENHLRTVKNTWATIQKIRSKSGFGWNDELKMITADKEVFNKEVMAHPNHEKYLNKKIAMYDEMALVVGRAIATGSFAKQFGEFDLNLESDSPLLELEEDDENGANGHKEKTSNPPNQRSHRKQKLGSETFENKMLDHFSEVAGAIKELSEDKLDIQKLYNEVMKMKEFDKFTLAAVFDYLVENEKLQKISLSKVMTFDRYGSMVLSRGNEAL